MPALHFHFIFWTSIAACGRVSSRLKHTVLVCLTPPTVHTKSRFMNVHRLVRWADRVLGLLPAGRAKAGPVLAKLRTFPEWRLLVMPDHPTNVATRKHGYAPSPFAMAGTGVAKVNPSAYSERNAAASGLRMERGHELMEYFLRGGGR